MPCSQGFNYLASRGFALFAVGPVGMFPQVCHVETVVLHPSIFSHTERYGFIDFPNKNLLSLTQAIGGFLLLSMFPGVRLFAYNFLFKLTPCTVFPSFGSKQLSILSDT